MNDFTVKLESITNGENTFSFKIDDSFFEGVAFSELRHANISTIAKLNKDGENISLNLIINGKINRLTCDICTDELSVKISGETNVIIKKY